MHFIKINFKKNIDKNALWHNVHSVIGALRENGQINGREHNPYITANTMSATLWTFTKVAMAKKYWNKYVKTAIENLEKLCENKLEISYLGSVEEELESVCTCKTHKCFVLYYYGDFSPIRCGTCEKFVP